MLRTIIFGSLISIPSILITSLAIAETTNASNHGAETIEAHDSDAADDSLDQYFDLDDNDSDATSSPLSAQATTDETAPATDETTATTAPSEATAPASKPIKKKKKKRKKKPSKTTSVEENTASVEGVSTGHGTQDSGLPYKANIDLGFNFSSASSTKKYQDKAEKSSTSQLGLNVTWLFIFSKMEVGPIFRYSTTSVKEDDFTEKSNTLGIGGAFFMNFGNIHSDKLVPYAGVSVLMDTISNDSSKETTKKTNLGLQGGLKYFLGAHLALKPYLSYELTLSGEEKDESSDPATVGSLTGSKLDLGIGLAKYF
jgi:hypothetical protein